MSTKVRAVDLGSEKGRTIIRDLGAEVRLGRQDHGLSQATVARAARTSRSQVGRVERGEAPRVPLVELARLLAVVGLELSARAYPAGPPIRDAAHGKLLDRLRAGSAASVAWRFEVPIGLPGDHRAWDAVILIGRTRVAVEAETRPRDIQALQRRIALKRRDSPDISATLLLLADTRHNRNVVREHGNGLRTDLPLPGRVILGALADGRDPGGSGIVLL
jgi:transcriptional regulator with XRE-family HTH domain